MSKATFVVDLSCGSSGKGKVAYHIANEYDEDVHFVRTGGPQSGHTVHTLKGELLSFRQLGAGAVLPNTVNYMSAGCIIREDRLALEVQQVNLPKNRLVIDPRAALWEQADADAEARMVSKMGSTASGNGFTMARRMMRNQNLGVPALTKVESDLRAAGFIDAANFVTEKIEILLNTKVRFAGDSEICNKLGIIKTVAPILHEALSKDEVVIVEGVQGMLLSLLHSEEYPYCTSRDTSPVAFASEVGLAHKHMGKVIGVVRSFPIRVGGNSGPLKGETTWEKIAKESGAPAPRPELTTVTKRLRRVAEFDFDETLRACRYTTPDMLAIMGVDNLQYSDLGARRFEDLSNKSKEFIFSVEDYTGIPVGYIGTGPHTDDIIWRSV